LHRVAAAGGQAVPWLELDQARKEISQAWPQFLPDGRRFLYFSVCADPSLTGMYMGSLDSRETRMVYRSASPGRYAAPSFLVMAREQTLIAQVFDLRTLRVSSEASVIADGVGPLYMGGGAFSVSDNGILVHRGTLAAGAQLGSYNREGRRLELVGSPGNYRQLTLSPDERRLAIEISPGPTRGGIWLLEISVGILSRAASGANPVWSPDGRQLAFNSRGGLARKAIGARDELPILELKEPGYTKQWLKDGSILFLSQGGKIFYLLPAMENAAPQNSTERKPMPLLETDFDKDRPTISPDGRWVAYNSLESGRWEVYVAAFPGFTDKRQVSSAGGCQPHWRKDGKELFYLALDGKLMTVDVTTDGGKLRQGRRNLSSRPQSESYRI
jgi:hypothetical protein